MTANDVLFLQTACEVGEVQNSSFINNLESLVDALGSKGMSESEMIESQNSLSRTGYIKIHPAMPPGLQLFKITGAGVAWFYIRRYGLAGYEKIVDDVSRILHERSMAGMKATSEAIAKVLKVPEMLVHHIFVNTL
jgi:hypothetical protein